MVLDIHLPSLIMSRWRNYCQTSLRHGDESRRGRRPRGRHPLFRCEGTCHPTLSQVERAAVVSGLDTYTIMTGSGA